ncbi:globin domain-containing protein [Marinifaba aquimaris]|uniref:globin domain-containing protein n=1 Tax=Marinifaba aquimaris TaxID=2741323 RepID=UPI001C2CF1A9|nr:globin domain-containing protein [Marinifaba aquimaris]
MFYNRLFEIDPSTRQLFSSDIDEQGKKLMTVLTTVVRGLKRIDQLQQTVWQLGRRHAVYKVTDKHHSSVAQALLWTLEQGLGTAFDKQTRQAWTDAYTLQANVMREGANHPNANYDDWLEQS